MKRRTLILPEQNVKQVWLDAEALVIRLRTGAVTRAPLKDLFCIHVFGGVELPNVVIRNCLSRCITVGWFSRNGRLLGWLMAIKEEKNDADATVARWLETITELEWADARWQEVSENWRRHIYGSLGLMRNTPDERRVWRKNRQLAWHKILGEAVSTRIRKNMDGWCRATFSSVCNDIGVYPETEPERLLLALWKPLWRDMVLALDVAGWDMARIHDLGHQILWFSPVHAQLKESLDRFFCQLRVVVFEP